jgi:tetratricopeptide (TPR) repeat protein
MKLIQDQTEMASSLMDAGQAPAAVRMLGEALRFEPDNLSLQLSFARALLRADNPRGAERVLLEIAKRTPSNLAVRVNVSLVAQALGKTNEALAAADQALELATNNASAYLARANALLAMERDREALESLETVARLDPQDAGVRVQIGDVLLLNLGQTNAALRSYQKASDVDPTLAAAQVRLAQLHIEAGRTNEARQAVARLKRIAPEDRSIEILESRLARAEKGKGS